MRLPLDERLAAWPQARADKLTLVTVDRQLERYDVALLLA